MRGLKNLYHLYIAKITMRELIILLRNLILNRGTLTKGWMKAASSRK